MSRILKTEDLTNVGSQLLRSYHQELEFFRRPPLNEESKIVYAILEANQTRRLEAYIQSGSRHAYMDMQNICKLNLCLDGLHSHLIKVKSLIDELQSLSDNGIAIAETVNLMTSHSCDESPSDCFINQACSPEEGELAITSHQSKHSNDESKSKYSLCESILHRAILMRTLYNMLNLDYEMQSKVILSLNLSSSSEELESYCLMWELRPFINDNVLHQCWQLLSG